MRKYFFAVMAIAALVACSKDELPADPDLDSSMKSVSISIANMASDTRATEGGLTTQATDGVACTAINGDFYILFLDSGNIITAVYNGDDLRNYQTTVATGNYTFHALPDVVTQVAAVGNLTTTPNIGQDLNTLVTQWTAESAETIAAEYTSLIAYAKATPLIPSNERCVDQNTGKAYPLYGATVTVEPIMARIEITQISCIGFGASNVGYDAIGVTGMSLAGGNLAGTQAKSTNAPYTYTFGSFSSDNDLFTLGAQHVLVPSNSNSATPNPTSNPSALIPGQNKAWSWNIAPQEVSELVTSLYVSGDGYTTTVPVRTVTVASYTRQGTTEVINSFVAGKIYRFAIDFQYDNIDTADNYLCANVEVVIQPWTVIPADVVFKTPSSNNP